MTGRTFRTAPWRRAPVLLAAQPVVVAAIMLASAVLSIAASSAPLFLSTIGTAALQSAAAQRCPEQAMPSVGLTYGNYAYNGYGVGQNSAISARLATSFPARGLPAPVNVVWGRTTMSATTPRGPIANLPANVFAKPGAIDHVHKLTSSGRRGVWITNLVSQQTGLRAGMTLRLGGRAVPIAGTYRALSDPLDPSQQLPRFWCTWDSEVVPSVILQTPYTFVIADDPNFVLRASAEIHSTWYSPVDVAHQTLDRSSASARAGDAAGGALSRRPIGALLRVDRTFTSMTTRARHVQTGLAGAIVPIAAGGMVIAMLLVAGAGWFWALRRRREIGLLVARGISPGALGAKAVLETLPWIVAGGGIGLVLTVLLVRQLGPAAALEGAAIGQAAGLIGVVIAIAALVIAVIGAGAGRDAPTLRRLRLRGLRFVPFELALIAAAVSIYTAAHGKGIVVDDQGTVQLGPAVLAFPLLGFAGALLLITRLLRQGLPGLRRVAERSRMATFLAFTRVASSPAVALGVVIGVALPCGMLVYASGLERSLGSSVQAKYETNLGAAHVLSAVSSAKGTFALHGTGTQVTVIQQAHADNGEEVRILGVDPATFDRFAYVHGAQRDQVRELGSGPAAGSVRAIAANLDRGGAIHAVDVAGTKVQLDVIATPAAFPGLRNPYEPMIVVDRRALAHLPEHIERAEQVWTTAARRSAASAVLSRAHIQVLYELSPQVVVGTTGLLPVTWVLAYLRALALLVGLVALAGLVFALAARAKRTAVAYILTRRMGVRRVTHLASLVTELALIVGAGWLLGTALAEGAVGVVYRLLDTYPQFPPPPRFMVDGAVVVSLGLVAVLVVLASAGFAQVLADRADPAETMRTL